MERELSSIDRQMDQMVHELASEFQLQPEAVQPVVADSFRTFSESRIKAFVPILARRHARRALRGTRGVA